MKLSGKISEAVGFRNKLFAENICERYFHIGKAGIFAYIFYPTRNGAQAFRVYEHVHLWTNDTAVRMTVSIVGVSVNDFAVARSGINCQFSQLTATHAG